MPKTRETTLPQHHMTQGHYGEFDLEFLPVGVNVGDAIIWSGTTWVITNVTPDGKVLVTEDDTTRAFLGAKIVAGDNIVITILNPGADETIEVSSTASGGGAGEVLMEDGTSFPPVPLTTEDGTDWLYEG